MVEPLQVKPKAAFTAIGVGNTRGYELIAEGKLELVKDGRSSFVTWDSVKSYAASLRRDGQVSHA